MLILVGGKFCSGKTTLCRYVISKYKNFIEINLADKLKEIAKDLFFMEEKNRTLLQSLGNKIKEIDEYVWINYLYKKTIPELRKRYKNKHIIIGDIRFLNELEFFKNKFSSFSIYIDTKKIIRLERHKKIYSKLPTKEELKNKSEKLSKDYFDLIITNNHSLNDFYKKIDIIFNKNFLLNK